MELMSLLSGGDRTTAAMVSTILQGCFNRIQALSINVCSAFRDCMWDVFVYNDV